MPRRDSRSWHQQGAAALTEEVDMVGIMRRLGASASGPRGHGSHSLADPARDVVADERDDDAGRREKPSCVLEMGTETGGRRRSGRVGVRTREEPWRGPSPKRRRWAESGRQNRTGV